MLQLPANPNMTPRAATIRDATNRDAVFDLIAKHKAAAATFEKAAGVRSRMNEAKVTKAKLRAADKAVDTSSKACMQAAHDFMNHKASTIAGVIAQASHIRAQLKNDAYMPSDLTLKTVGGMDANYLRAWLDRYFDTLVKTLARFNADKTLKCDTLEEKRAQAWLGLEDPIFDLLRQGEILELTLGNENLNPALVDFAGLRMVDMAKELQDQFKECR